MIRWLIALLASAACTLSAPAWPHGDAEWIPQGGYRSPSGVFCCGVSDCRPLPEKTVRPVSSGYVIKVDEGEVVAPYDRFLPSEDDHFWVCGGMTPDQWRCLFAPPMGA